MSLTKIFYIVFVSLFVSISPAQTRSAKKPVAKPVSKPVSKPVAKPVAKPKQVQQVQSSAITPPAPVIKTFSRFEVGSSYYMWNEGINISNGTNEAEGFANYAGFGFNLEQNWATGRWFRGVALGYSFGKTSSGGFDSTPAFADGINRSWQATQLSVFSFYRFNSTFSAGPGLFARQRDADWQPKDQTLTVKPQSATQIAGQIIMRWQILDRLAILQSYTLLNFKDSTMWTWSAQFSL